MAHSPIVPVTTNYSIFVARGKNSECGSAPTGDIEKSGYPSIKTFITIHYNQCILYYIKYKLKHTPSIYCILTLAAQPQGVWLSNPVRPGGSVKHSIANN